MIAKDQDIMGLPPVTPPSQIENYNTQKGGIVESFMLDNSNLNLKPEILVIDTSLIAANDKEDAT